MLAGRYFWWVVVSIAGVLAMSILFEYALLILVRTFGCREITASCGRAAITASMVAQIAAFWLFSILLLAATFTRLRFLAFSRGWGLAALFFP